MLPASFLRVALIVLGAFTALSAVGGGIALLTPGSAGVPLYVLDGSIFTSFFWPALLLGIVIGGTQLIATVTAIRRSPTWLAWSHVAALRELPADQGLNAFIRAHAAETIELPWPSDEILRDLDTPEDYQRLLN